MSGLSVKLDGESWMRVMARLAVRLVWFPMSPATFRSSHAAFFAGRFCFLRDLAVAFFFAPVCSSSSATRKPDRLLWLAWALSWFFFNLFAAGFHFFLDHFHERFAVVVVIFFRIPTLSSCFR